MRHGLGFAFAVVTTAIATASAGLYTYWELFDIKAPMQGSKVLLLDINGQPTTHYRPGDTMLVQRESCIVEDGPALFTRSIKGSDGTPDTYFASSSYAQFNSEGCRVAYTEIQLPRYMKPGNYQYIVTVTFQKNPIKWVTQNLDVAHFDIDPPPPAHAPAAPVHAPPPPKAKAAAPVKRRK